MILVVFKKNWQKLCFEKPATQPFNRHKVKQNSCTTAYTNSKIKKSLLFWDSDEDIYHQTIKKVAFGGKV